MEGDSNNDKKPPPNPLKKLGTKVRSAASKNNPYRCFGRPLGYVKIKTKGPPLLRTESPTLESVAQSKAKSRWVNGEQMSSRPSYEHTESEELHYARRMLRCNQYQETQLLYLNAELECDIDHTQEEINTIVPPVLFDIISNQNAIVKSKAKCVEMKKHIAEMDIAEKLWPAISDVYRQEGEFVQQIGDILDMLENCLHLLPLDSDIQPYADLKSTDMLSLIEQMDRTLNTLQEIEEIMHPTKAMVELDRSQRTPPSGHHNSEAVGSTAFHPCKESYQSASLQCKHLVEGEANPNLDMGNLPVAKILESGVIAKNITKLISHHKSSLEEAGKEVEAGERVTAALCSLRLGEIHHGDVLPVEIEADFEVDQFFI